METDPKSGGTPPLWKIPDFFFFFIEPFPYSIRECRLPVIQRPGLSLMDRDKVEPRGADTTF